jgi:multiple sugar transport system permease protein
MIGKQPKRSGIMKMEKRWGVIMALPVMIGFIVFMAGPIIASFVFSLADWQIGGDFHFVGFDNYIKAFTKDALFKKSLLVTAYYTIGRVPLTIIIGFGVAVLLNQKVRGLSIFRTIYYLPVIVPSIANAMLWLWMFNPQFGLLNTVLRAIGLPGLQWIYDSGTAIPSLIIMSTWGMGNAVVIFLAGLQAVPIQLYEAVDVDGGNAFHKLVHVTIPSMTPTIFFNLVMSMIAALQIFNEAYVMTNGGPNNATLFYVYYIFRTAFQNSSMGYASALSWVLFVIIIILTLVLFKSSNRWVYYEGGDKR